MRRGRPATSRRRTAGWRILPIRGWLPSPVAACSGRSATTPPACTASAVSAARRCSFYRRNSSGARRGAFEAIGIRTHPHAWGLISTLTKPTHLLSPALLFRRYMLNQLTLDRGPASAIPAEQCAGGNNDNCWASGNAGEMDFLETGWNLRNISDDPLFRRSFSTQFNQIGRCFNGGVNGGGFTSSNWLETSPPPLHGDAAEPIVYVAVVDSVGNWVYRIPADEAAAIWPGIARKTSEARLPAHPARTPEAMNPCSGGYCAVFTSNCQAANVSAARAQGCGFNGDQGFCGNVWRSFADTNQPLFPNASCLRDVRGGAEMPWCVEMVNAQPSVPTPAPAPGPAPTPDCPACSQAQCAGEGCGKSVPYLCLGGAAKGGCTGDPKGWPSSGACSGCCDSYACQGMSRRTQH